MKRIIKKYLNIYVVIALIGGFSFLYMLSFAFIVNDISKGSSLQMKRDMIEKQKNSTK